MVTGNVTLLEALKHGNETAKMGVIETIIQENAWVEILPWVPFAGTALKHTVEDTLPQQNFRQVNATYTKSWGTDTEHFWGVAILGGEIFVDNFLVDVIDTKNDLKAKQYAKAAKASSMRFGYEVENGTGGSNGFKGIKTLVAEGFGQTMNVSAGVGAALTLDALDTAMDLFLNQGGADVLMTNRTVRRKITSLARTSVTGVSLIDVGTDVFGRKVTMYNDVPIRFGGQIMDSSGNITTSFPFTEDPGNAVLTSASIWMLKLSEDDVTGLLGKGGSFDMKDFGETEAAPGHLGRLEWYPGLAIFNKYSVVRLAGILNA